MQNIIGSEKFSRENRDPPYPSLYREGMLVIENPFGEGASPLNKGDVAPVHPKTQKFGC